MFDSPNKLAQFWQELKRRRVIHVIIVYATAAFVIIELINNVTEPLNLPEWTPTLIIIILLVGFPLAIIFSWIFDVTPKGVQKTKPSKEISKGEKVLVPNSWRIATYVSVVVIIGLIVFNLTSQNKRSKDILKLDKTIAVIPFENWSIDEEFSHLGDAIANEINTQLAKINDFHVFSYTSSSRFKGDNKPSIPEIGQEIGANFIVEGTVERQNEDVSIHVQVIQVNTDDHIWANEFRGKWENIFTIRAEIAVKIAEELKTVLSPEEIYLIEKKPGENTEAYNLFLLGRSYYNRFTKENINIGIKYFDRAIQLDSTLALAYVGLAQSYQVLARHSWMPREEAYPKAKRAVTRAIKIDDSLGEAYAALGLIMIVFDYDIYGPDQLFQEAIRLSPKNAEVYSTYSQYLRWLTWYEKGLKMARRAVELDPLTSFTVFLPGSIYTYMGRYDESIAYLNDMLTRDSSFIYAYSYLAYNHMLKGMCSDALFYANKIISRTDPINNPMVFSTMGMIYGKCGEIEIARRILSKIEELEQHTFVDPFHLAGIYYGLRNYDKMFEMLNKAYDIRSGQLIYLKTLSGTFYKDFSSDPRYIELLEKIGFEIE